MTLHKDLNGLNTITKWFGTIICMLTVSGVVGIWVMVVDISSLKAQMNSFGHRLDRIENLIDTRIFRLREE